MVDPDWKNGREKATRLKIPNDVIDIFGCSPDGEWIFFLEAEPKGEWSISKIRRDGKGYQVLRKESEQ